MKLIIGKKYMFTDKNYNNYLPRQIVEYLGNNGIIHYVMNRERGTMWVHENELTEIPQNERKEK